MSWNGSVRILVIHTRPVCTSLMKNRCTVRNSRPPTPTISQIMPTWRTNSAMSVCGVEQAEQRRIEIEQQRRQRPDRHQHDLALQIVADLDLFLVLVRRLVDVVVVASARRRSGRPGAWSSPTSQPSSAAGAGIEEHQHIGAQEADRADQMQRLVDAAVVIVAMIVPALDSAGLRESRACASPVDVRVLLRFVTVLMTVAVRHTQPVRRGARAIDSAPVSVLPKRISEKCPSGGIGRRSIRRMPCVRVAQRR